MTDTTSNVAHLSVASKSPQERHREAIATSLRESFDQLAADGPWDGYAIVAYRHLPDGATQPFARWHTPTGFEARCLPHYASSALQEALEDACR